MQEDQKPISIPANYVLYRVATSTIPGLTSPPGRPTYYELVMSNEALEAHHQGDSYVAYAPCVPCGYEVFTIYCGEAYEICYEKKKLVAFETPRVDPLDRNVPHYSLEGPE